MDTTPPAARSPRRWAPLVIAAALLTSGGLAPASVAQWTMPHAAAATSAVRAPAPDVEAQFISRINSLRASKGLSQLKVSGELTGVARNWTERMVADGKISHNPNLGSQVSGNWTKLGENVGVGYDVDGLMQAFINSPAHYRNLVDPDWNNLGVGVVLTPDGRMWTTHNFMAKPESPPPAPPPSSSPAPSPSPKPAATSGSTSNTAKSTSGGTRSAAAPATTTTTAPPPPPQPQPNVARVGAVLTPLRWLEGE